MKIYTVFCKNSFYLGIYFGNIFLKVQCCLHRYVRMSPERFEHLLQLAGPKITKQNKTHNSTPQ